MTIENKAFTLFLLGQKHYARCGWTHPWQRSFVVCFEILEQIAGFKLFYHPPEQGRKWKSSNPLISEWMTMYWGHSTVRHIQHLPWCKDASPFKGKVKIRYVADSLPFAHQRPSWKRYVRGLLIMVHCSCGRHLSCSIVCYRALMHLFDCLQLERVYRLFIRLVSDLGYAPYKERASWHSGVDVFDLASPKKRCGAHIQCLSGL